MNDQSASVLSRRGRVRRVSAAALAFGILAGCSSNIPPRLEVQEAAITQQTERGIVVTFLVSAENRNSDPLPMRNVSYSLEIEGRGAFTATRSAEATIPAFGVQSITLPVALSIGSEGDLSEVPTVPLPYSFSGSVEYELPGAIAEVLFDTGIRRPSAGFSERGRLDSSGSGTTVEQEN